MIKTFLNSESGAVTVDWVVLTAAIVGLGLAVMAVVSAGVEDLSNDIEASCRPTASHDFGVTGASQPSKTNLDQTLPKGRASSRPFRVSNPEWAERNRLKFPTISFLRPNRAPFDRDSQLIPRGQTPKGPRNQTWSKTMIKTFLNSESGAVTVDWVVLTAAIVGLGLAVMAVVSAGVEDLSNDG